MSVLGKVRLQIGRLLSRVLARAFGSPWAQRVLVHEMSPASRLELIRAAAEKVEGTDALLAQLLAGLPPPEIERAYDRAVARAETCPEALAYALLVFGSLHEWIATYAGGVQGKKILELGPGHSFAMGALLVASGAEQWIGADYYPVANLDPRFYARLRAALATDRNLVRSPGHYPFRQQVLRRFDEVVRLEKDTVSFDERRLAWRCPVDAAKLPFPDASFSICFSNAAFEHFADPDAAVRESLRVLEPGGVGLHQVDLRDHRDFARPFDFLQVSDAEWKVLSPERSFDYTNRWRRDDFARAFRAAGGEVVEARVSGTAALPEGLRSSLDPRFRALPREDLEALGAFFVIRKPLPTSAPTPTHP